MDSKQFYLYCKKASNTVYSEKSISTNYNTKQITKISNHVQRFFLVITEPSHYSFKTKQQRSHKESHADTSNQPATTFEKTHEFIDTENAKSRVYV